jgi:hypothetical protein
MFILCVSQLHFGFFLWVFFAELVELLVVELLVIQLLLVKLLVELLVVEFLIKLVVEFSLFVLRFVPSGVVHSRLERPSSNSGRVPGLVES